MTIGDNLWIGGAATILAAIIDAGSVVTHDVSAGATVVGKPARARPWRQARPDNGHEQGIPNTSLQEG